MSPRGSNVPRPQKAAEYDIVYGNNSAQKGWNDLKATSRNALVDAWDYLTRHPDQYDENRCYQFKGELSTITANGTELPQWQYKVTNGARIRYAIQTSQKGSKGPRQVILIRVDSGHPNDTDSQKNFR